MEYVLRIAGQLKQQLRSLRKARGLSQAALGELLGVSQRRVAEIEADPAVVSVEQITRMLAALGCELVLRETPPASRRRAAGASPAASRKTPPRATRATASRANPGLAPKPRPKGQW